MYPLEIKQSDYKITFLDIFKDIMNFMITGFRSFRSFKTFILFLEKKFHF